MTDGPASAGGRRRNLNTALYNAAFVRLFVGALFFFLLTLAAAYFALVPRGMHTARAVRPVLDEFMTAAAANDVQHAHRLLSTDALRVYRQEDIAALLEERQLFAGYTDLQITEFQMLPEAGTSGEERAHIVAVVRYEGGRSARLVAETSLDGREWRVRKLRVEPAP
jgi:hypothetical protein